MQAFIQPETLDGPNQYFCERCKKKCDARKVSTLQMLCQGSALLLTCLIHRKMFLYTGAEISALSLPADTTAEAV